MVIPTALHPPHTPVQLTADDIKTLRERVASAASRRTRRKPPTWRQYVGGPLDGLLAALDDVDGRCAFHGWATMTRGGCVQVLYRREGESLVFDSLN